MRAITLACLMAVATASPAFAQVNFRDRVPQTPPPTAKPPETPGQAAAAKAAANVQTPQPAPAPPTPNVDVVAAPTAKAPETPQQAIAVQQRLTAITDQAKNSAPHPMIGRPPSDRSLLASRLGLNIASLSQPFTMAPGSANATNRGYMVAASTYLYSERFGQIVFEEGHGELTLSLLQAAGRRFIVDCVVEMDGGELSVYGYDYAERQFSQSVSPVDGRISFVTPVNQGDQLAMMIYWPHDRPGRDYKLWKVFGCEVTPMAG